MTGGEPHGAGGGHRRPPRCLATAPARISSGARCAGQPRCLACRTGGPVRARRFRIFDVTTDFSGDRIILSDLGFFGYHGVMPEEAVLGQRFFVDLVCGIDLREAGRTDDLERQRLLCRDLRGDQGGVRGAPVQADRGRGAEHRRPAVRGLPGDRLAAGAGAKALGADRRWWPARPRWNCIGMRSDR